MSDQGVVVVHIGNRSLPLLPENPVAVAQGDMPAEAIAMVRCDTCGATGTLAAPVTYTFYDDEHFGRFELWYDSRHRGACSACGAAIDVHLGYTLTRYPLTGVVELSLNQLTQAAKRVVGGTLAPAAVADILASRQHRQAARRENPATMLVSRSSAECHLYIALHPCGCGAREFATEHKLEQGNTGLIARYWGKCPRCGITRAFDFALDPEIPPLDSYGGASPSRIICPGEFGLHSDRLASRWPADPRDIAPADRAQARDDLAWAIRALEEVVKFVPAAGGEVPAAAFTSQAGREARMAEPGRFRMVRLQARLGAYRALLEQLTAATPAADGRSGSGAGPSPAANDDAPGAARADTAPGRARPLVKIGGDAAGVWLTSLDVAVDRGLFAVGRPDGMVVVADIARAEPVWHAQPGTGRVTSLCFLDDVLWTAHVDGMLVALDVTRGTILRRFDAGHGRVTMVRGAGANLLITTGDDGNARLWRRDGGAALQTLDEKRHGPAYSVAATDGWITIGYRDGYVTIWQPDTSAGWAATWAYAGQLQPPGRGGSPLGAIAVAPGGHRVAFARDRRVTLCEPGSWRPFAELHTDLACNDVHFDSTGSTLVGACSERCVRVWRRQEMVGEPHGHWNRFGRVLGAGMERGQWAQELIYSGARFAGDDQVIATSFDGTVQLFRLSAPGLSPVRVAHYGGTRPNGWVDR